MAAELGVDRVARLAKDRSDRMRDVTDARPRSGYGDPRLERALGRPDDREALHGLCLAHHEADGGVRGDPTQGDGDVERQEVAIGQMVSVRQSVEHGVVHGRADVVVERPASEGGRVVDVAGLRACRIDHVPRPAVDVQEVRADCRAALQCLQDVGDQRPGLPRTGELTGVQNLDQCDTRTVS